jgi:hypothetical protein
MAKLKLEESEANGWGYYAYMYEGFRNGYVKRLKFRHSYVDAHGNKAYTIARAKKEGITTYWTNVIYFTVPIGNPVFGDLRNKGFIGFIDIHGKLILFDKPLFWSDALKAIEKHRIPKYLDIKIIRPRDCKYRSNTGRCHYPDEISSARHKPLCEVHFNKKVIVCVQHED